MYIISMIPCLINISKGIKKAAEQQQQPPQYIHSYVICCFFCIFIYVVK